MEIVFIVELSIGFLFWPSVPVVSFAWQQPSCLVFAIRKQSENPCCQVQMRLIFKVQLFSPYMMNFIERLLHDTFQIWPALPILMKGVLWPDVIVAAITSSAIASQTFLAKTAQFSAFIFKRLTGIKAKPSICLGAQQKEAGAYTTVQGLSRREPVSLGFALPSQKLSK